VAQTSPGLRRAIEELEAELALLRRLPDPDARRALRKAAGLTGHRTAQILGVTDMTVSLWERGEREPRGENLARYVELLDELRRVVAG
jgi:DNA-binding transcriptional regulator YiaG